MGIVILFILGALAIGVAGWMWRINIAINHPEKHERLLAFEEHLRKRQDEKIEKAKAAARAASVFAVKWHRRLKK